MPFAAFRNRVFAPANQESVTGTAEQKKTQIEMIALRLGLKSIPQEDAADAVAAAICHAQMLNSPRLPTTKSKKRSKKSMDAALLAIARERGMELK